MEPIDLLFLAYCVYVPLLILLYLAEIWIILKPGSPYKSSFYILFVAAAVVDIVFVFETFLDVRMPLFPLVNGIFENYDDGPLIRVRATISFICPCTHDILNCFVALTRFTSIRRPFQHREIWKKLLPFTICFSYLLSIAIFVAPGFRNVSYIKLALPGRTLYAFTIDQSFLPWVNISVRHPGNRLFISHALSSICPFNTNLVTTVEMGITSIITVILYSLAAISLHKLVGSKETAQQERMLLKYGVVNFVIAIPCMITQIIMGYQLVPFDWMLVVFYFLAPLIDIKFFSSAISMIIVNKPFRQNLLNSFKLSRCIKSDKSVSVSEMGLCRRVVQARKFTIAIDS